MGIGGSASGGGEGTSSIKEVTKWIGFGKSLGILCVMALLSWGFLVCLLSVPSFV